MKKPLLLSMFLALIFASFATKASFAKIGVGINTGKIQVDEKLKAGMIYKLPIITVINTGDQPSDYVVSIAFQQDQPEFRPKKEWFIFSPQKFHLEPGKTQLVETKINLPLKIEPGNYFAYLEARPVSTVEKGNTTIGIAAGSKLYFTVLPANFVYGIYYKITSFWKVYAPWPQRAVIAVLILFVLVIFKKFFKLQINLKKPDDKKTQVEEKVEEKNE